MKPRFQHDCPKCTYLGTISIPSVDNPARSVHHDLYYCPQGGRVPTVIARWGNPGPDYLSGINAAIAGLFPLNIALTLAARRGLIPAVVEED